MWSIYVKQHQTSETSETWIEVAGGYTLPTKAAADVAEIRQAWPHSTGVMIGMVVWRDE